VVTGIALGFGDCVKNIVVAGWTLNCPKPDEKRAAKFIEGIFGGIVDCSNLEA
jgi:hypothetical protein